MAPAERSRPAMRADLARIAELAAQLVDEVTQIKGGVLWGVREARPAPYDASYAVLLDRDDASLLVGTVDDVVLGFGAAEIERLRNGAALGVISDLYVEPQARGIGVGEKIAEGLLEFCRSHGCIGVDALALPGDRDTKNFFEGQGFSARSLTMHRPA